MKRWHLGEIMLALGYQSYFLCKRIAVFVRAEPEDPIVSLLYWAATWRSMPAAEGEMSELLNDLAAEVRDLSGLTVILGKIRSRCFSNKVFSATVLCSLEESADEIGSRYVRHGKLFGESNGFFV